MNTYQDTYPEPANVRSVDSVPGDMADLLSLEHFIIEPGSVSRQVYDQHFLKINLSKEPYRVENYCDGVNNDYVISKNDMVLVPAGVETAWTWHATSNSIIFTLNPQKVEKFALDEMGVQLSERQLKGMPLFYDQDIATVSNMLLDALHLQSPTCKILYESLAKTFLITLIDRYGIKVNHDKSQFSGLTEPQFKKVCHFIKERYSEKLCVSELAARVGMSANSFSMKFKKTTGQSIQRYLMIFRINQAKHMLANTQYHLCDVALKCGFSDQPHFSREFKRNVGVSPKFWRDRNNQIAH